MGGQRGQIRWFWAVWLWGGLWGLGACQTPPATTFQGQSWDSLTRQSLAYPSFLIDKATAERYRQQGLAYRAAGDLERAIATLNIAAALDPQNPNSHIILGWTQHLAGYPDDATAALQHALQQDPNQVEALNALGIVYLVGGQLDQATATHQRALALKPDNEIAHYNLSLAYERLRQWEPAIYHAQQATALEPENPHPWVALALAQAASGNPAQAEAPYQQAVRLDGRYRRREHLDHLAQAGFSDAQINAVAELQASLFP